METFVKPQDSAKTLRKGSTYTEMVSCCGPCQTPMAKLNKILKRRQTDWDKHVAVLITG